MLIYVDKRKTISAYRPEVKAGTAGRILIGTITKNRNFPVKLMPDGSATNDEIQELESVALGLKGADGERLQAILQFPASARQAVRFYGTKASPIDKQLIRRAVRKAARTIRKFTEPTKLPKQPPPPTKFPSHEALAGALFKILSQNTSAKVKGEPTAGKKTEIRGFWDLNSVARALLELA